jgi:hypothetical protein
MRVSDARIFSNVIGMTVVVRREFFDSSKTLMESMFSRTIQIRFQLRAHEKIRRAKIQ